MAEHIRLSPEWEASPGRYNVEENPWVRRIIDAFMDPEVRQITLKKSTQVGGTLLLIAVMLGLSELDPAPSMMVGPDELYCYEVRDRTYATGEESAAVRDNVPPERLRNGREIDLANCRYYLAWAGSAQRLRGRACKRVLRSEIDVYPKQTPRGGDPLKASAERVKRFYQSTIYNESSPDSDESSVDALYELGTQEQLYCPCPHCGHYQVLRFFPFKDGPRAGCGGIAGYLDEDGNHLEIEKAIKRVHYVCEHGCKIDQDLKNEMIRRCEWVQPGQKIGKDGKVTGTPTKSQRHLSFHVWSIHSSTIGLDDIVSAYIDHRIAGRLRDFFQNWLGRKYLSRRRVAKWHEVGRRLEGSHKRGQVPPQAWFLTAGIDVQEEGCYWVVRGWGDQSTSWLIDWGFVQQFSVEDFDVSQMSEDELNEFFRSDLRQLVDAVINRYFPTVGDQPNPLGKNRLRIRLAGIDSQHRTREVHAFVGSQDERRVMAIRGDHKTRPQDRFRETIVEGPTRGGPKYANPRKVLNIFTPHYKETINDKLLLPPQAPGSFNFYCDVVNTSADYLRQLCNERPTEIIDKQTGRKKVVWKVVSEHWGNHTGDGEVYSFAVAEKLLANLQTTWDASTWVVPKQRKRPDRAIEPPPLAAVRAEQL